MARQTERVYLVRISLALAVLMAPAAPGASSASLAPPRGVAPPPPGIEKIATWVLEHTAGGREAEFLVVLADQADLSAAAGLPTKRDKGRYVYGTLWNKARSTQGPLLAWLSARRVVHRPYYIVNLIWVKGDREIALALAARADVARIEGNPVIRHALPEPLSGPHVPETIEPGINYVNAPQVWAMGFTGQGIVVGGQDTGYRWDHNALKPHYRGWNGATADHDYNWHDSIHSGGGSCGADSPFPCDDNGHGTHTMGTMVGDDGGANQIGMAPGARWIGCRNMDQGNGTPATYLECFEFFLAPYPVGGTPAQGDPTKAPNLTNNSWACPPSEGCAWDTLQAAVEAQRAAGIMTVVSAGNSGPNCSTVDYPPAIYDAAYSVGALNTGTDNIASFSSRGPVTVDSSNRLKPDITAPGNPVRSSTRTTTSSYGFLSGTSMAGPHVAGAVALLGSAHPMLTNQVTLTEQILNDSAFRISSSVCSSSGWPNNTYGYGRVNVKAAVDLATALLGGTLTGAVSDAMTSTPIVSATVRASVYAAPAYTVTSNAAGLYSAVVPSHTYTISVSALGYFSTTIGNVVVNSGMTTTQNITLTPFLYYGTLLSPAAVAQAGDPGQTVTYTLTLTNTGNVADSYTMTVGSTAFTTLVMPTTLGPVNAGAGRSVTVTAQIPPNAAGGATSTATITATSHGDATQTSASILTTTVNTVRGVSLAPSAATQSSVPGATVTYSLNLTNTGNLTDTFTLGYSGNTWEVSLPVTITTLAMGESTSLTVLVTIPLTAATGMADMVQVTATGIGASQTATLTTTAVLADHKLYLPLVIRPAEVTAQRSTRGNKTIRSILFSR